MQNSVLKNLLTFLILILPILGFSQDYSLKKADSLFTQKRYTQSLDIYRTLFDNGNYTPAMLLKMAYVEEGLNHISLAAYYLNLYYLATYDESVVQKLNELAEKNKLEGYERTDTDWALSLYFKNQLIIILSSLFITLFFILLSGIQKLRSKNFIGAYIASVIFSGITLIVIYFGTNRPYAIIGNKNSYLMEGPSAGASVITVLKDGHRVKIKEKKDVWVKVVVGEKEGYIKESNLLLLSL